MPRLRSVMLLLNNYKLLIVTLIIHYEKMANFKFSYKI